MTRITIESLAYGGAGVGKIEGKTVFVPFSAPGDILDINVVRDKHNFAEAEIVQIIEPASCRTLPQCPVFGECGGCQWQHLEYQTQLEWKRNILSETLERIGDFENPSILDTMPSPKEWNYRNRIQLHVDSEGHVGFYKARTNEVVEFEKCFIADDRLNQMLREQRSKLSKRTKGMGLRLEHGPHFSQVNVEQNENVRKLILHWLGEVGHQTIVELYAGSGNFTFPMAEVAERIIALEIDGRAVKFARQHAERKGIDNINFHCLPAERLKQAFHKGSPDVVLLNPPRKGASEAIPAIVERKPQTIFYMSCNPSTLARDLKVLAQSGWKLTRCQPIDMFPQTYHIEALTQMER